MKEREPPSREDAFPEPIRDVTLEDLGQRYPEVERDVNRLTFEIGTSEPPAEPPRGGRGRSTIYRVLRDAGIAIGTGILLLWLCNFFPVLVPG